MTAPWDRPAPPPAPTAPTRPPFVRQLGPAVAACLAVLLLAVLIGNRLPVPWRYVVMLLPVAPLAWLVVAVASLLALAGPLVRRAHHESMAEGFGASMVAAVGVGLLGVAGLAFRGAGWVVFTIGLVTWLIGMLVRLGRDQT